MNLHRSFHLKYVKGTHKTWYPTLKVMKATVGSEGQKSSLINLNDLTWKKYCVKPKLCFFNRDLPVIAAVTLIHCAQNLKIPIPGTGYSELVPGMVLRETFNQNFRNRLYSFIGWKSSDLVKGFEKCSFYEFDGPETGTKWPPFQIFVLSGPIQYV